MPIVHSLRARVLLWVSLALIALFAVTIAGLDVVFRRSTDQAIEDLLQTQLLGLIALAEETTAQDEPELTLPADSVINPQFGVANSGLYGLLWNADGVPVWLSSSLLGREFTVPVWPAPGEQRYFTVRTEELPELEAHVMGITWDFSDGHSLPYTFGVAASLEPYEERQAAYRRNLIGWFSGITLAMLAVLTVLLSVVLRPLRRLEGQVREVEAGARAQLTGAFPSELSGLARNLNALIGTERRRLVRYRNTLDDLAHSLKTPLAAMRSLLAEGTTDSGAFNREIDRMDQRVSHQLRRARASGATGLGVEPIRVAPHITDIVDTLDKVYRDKQVSCELDIEPDAKFQGDPGDFSELVGNLLDNAYKYCKRRVAVQVSSTPSLLILVIADDGPGIEAAELDALLERGGRADESIPGQGIGLAVVSETVELYGGSLSFSASEYGGTKVRVELARPGFAVLGQQSAT